MKKKRERKPSEIPATMADVIRAKAEATNKASRLAVIIFFSVLLDKEGYDRESLGRVWKHIEDRSEDIKTGRVKLTDWEKVLKEEYGIEVFKI